MTTLDWSTSPNRPLAIAKDYAYTVGGAGTQWGAAVWSIGSIPTTLADEYEEQGLHDLAFTETLRGDTIVDTTPTLGKQLLPLGRFDSREDAIVICEAFEAEEGDDLRLRRDKALRALGYAPESHRLMRIIRDGLGLTGEELAGKLKVSARTVRKWEAGQLKVSTGAWFDLYDLEETAAKHVTDGVPEGEEWPNGWRRAIAFRQRHQA